MWAYFLDQIVVGDNFLSFLAGQGEFWWSDPPLDDIVANLLFLWERSYEFCDFLIFLLLQIIWIYSLFGNNIF